MNRINAHVSGHKSIVSILLVVAGLVGLNHVASAQLIYADSFNYPDGKIVGAPGSAWVNNYEPTNEASVVSGKLFLTQSLQESIRVDFSTNYTSGQLYSRMTVNFSALPAGQGNFFAFFRVNNTDNLRCRIWASTNGAAAGRFRLGITTIFTPPTMIARDLFLGTNYTLVSRYEIANCHSTLWINPTDESAVIDRADDFTDVGQINMGHFGFAQTPYFFAGSGNYIGDLTVDDLRIGRTFAEVLPLVKFISISRTNGGPASLQAIGQATTNYVLLANTNLVSTNWESINTNAANAFGSLSLTDYFATNYSSRYYRLLKQ
jgi:hypothetical protein